jgi:hypothetical protein
MEVTMSMSPLRLGPRRTLAGLLAGIALLAGIGTPTALAAQPIRSWLPLPDTVRFAAGDECSYPVRLDVLVKGEYTLTSTATDGLTIIRTTGQLIVRVVNETNDRNVTINISGPGLQVTRPDGSSTVTFYGNGLPFVLGQLYVSSGIVVQEYAPDGSLISTSTPIGHVRDLCAELQ